MAAPGCHCRVMSPQTLLRASAHHMHSASAANELYRPIGSAAAHMTSGVRSPADRTLGSRQPPPLGATQHRLDRAESSKGEGAEPGKSIIRDAKLPARAIDQLRPQAVSTDHRCRACVFAGFDITNRFPAASVRRSVVVWWPARWVDSRPRSRGIARA